MTSVRVVTRRQLNPTVAMMASNAFNGPPGHAGHGPITSARGDAFASVKIAWPMERVRQFQSLSNRARATGLRHSTLLINPLAVSYQ